MFVTITYHFTTDDDENVHNSLEAGSCEKATYIWSEKVLYLQFLCPKALRFLTLFAIQVSETSVTIKLPCIRSDVRASLLSRLTYQVRTLTISYS